MKNKTLNSNIIIRIYYPVVIIMGFLISYWAAFFKMSIRWNSGDNNYCYLVVPLFIYLLYDQRNHFHFKDFSWNMLGIIPVLFSIGLIMIGELGSVETLLYIGLWGCVIGIMFTLYGRRIRYLTFPLIILLFIVPLPPFINRILTFQLKLAASSIAVVMLRGTGVSVFREGNIIDLGITQLQVVDACSGLRYLMPLVLLALLVGYFFTKGWWRRGVLLILVVPLSVFFNSLRIWLTGMLTINGYKELADSIFHEFSGWLIFMIAGGILVVAALTLNRMGSKPEKKPIEDPGWRPVGPVRPIVLTAVICLMFISSGWALREIPSAGNLPARTAFKSFPLQVGEWTGRKNYLSKEIMDQLWADDYVSAVFSRKDSRNIIYLFIPFYEYQGTRHTAHAPQSCLLGGGWALFDSRERVVKLNAEDPIKIMTMTLQKGDAKILGSYFFFQRGRVITSPWVNKFYLMWDAFTKRRTDGALVRVEMAMYPNQSMEDAYAILENFIGRLWQLLPDYVPG
jgi:exosortase D (VPLPA-CTERM-specific)